MSKKPARTLREPRYSGDENDREDELKRYGKSPREATAGETEAIGDPIA